MSYTGYSNIHINTNLNTSIKSTISDLASMNNYINTLDLRLKSIESGIDHDKLSQATLNMSKAAIAFSSTQTNINAENDNRLINLEHNKLDICLKYFCVNISSNLDSRI